MPKKRTDRLNSLLKEVISDVVRRDVNNPKVAELVTITSVDITKDLRFAKVYVSVIGSQQEKADTLEALKKASGFISMTASKQIVIRYFPQLKFILDESIEKHMRIDELLQEITEKKNEREDQLPHDGIAP